MKTKIIIILFFVLLTLFPCPSFAAKKRVWSSATTSTAATTPSVSASITRNRQTINLSFYGLKSTQSVVYELTYVGNGLDQGVYGSIKSAETNGSAFRPLYLGTCSRKVCTPHRNVNNARLTVTFKLKTGRDLAKTYRIRL